MKQINGRMKQSNLVFMLQISQIAKILNAHMNSLQWIDRNSAQVNTYLDQISKMQEQMIHFHS